MKKVFALALFALCAAHVGTAVGLSFIQDNYATALSQAKQRNVPIFVEVWAPW